MVLTIVLIFIPFTIAFEAIKKINAFKANKKIWVELLNSYMKMYQGKEFSYIITDKGLRTTYSGITYGPWHIFDDLDQLDTVIRNDFFVFYKDSHFYLNEGFFKDRTQFIRTYDTIKDLIETQKT